jgi:hypothetical protein
MTLTSCLLFTVTGSTGTVEKKWWNPVVKTELNEKTYADSKKRKRVKQNSLKPTQFLIKNQKTDINATPKFNKRIEKFDKEWRDSVFIKRELEKATYKPYVIPEKFIFKTKKEEKRKTPVKRVEKRPAVKKTEPKDVHFYDNVKSNNAVIPKKFTIKKKQEKLSRRHR